MNYDTVCCWGSKCCTPQSPHMAVSEVPFSLTSCCAGAWGHLKVVDLPSAFPATQLPVVAACRAWIFWICDLSIRLSFGVTYSRFSCSYLQPFVSCNKTTWNNKLLGRPHSHLFHAAMDIEAFLHLWTRRTAGWDCQRRAPFNWCRI